MSDFTAIGQPKPIVDGYVKLTGRAQYVTDLNLPGLLHARFVPSQYAHANIVSINKEDALAVPGVEAVLTADDLPNIVPDSRKTLLLARGRVIFVGQPVALILATSEMAAADGAERVMVDYEPLPAAVTIEEALAPDAPLVWPDGVPKSRGDAGEHGADVSDDDDDDDDAYLGTNIVNEKTYARGDVNTGFAAADVIVEHTYTSPMVHQSSLETQGMIAQPDPATGGAVVWTSTQDPFGVRKEVANLLGVIESDVRVQAMTVGGAFGAKFTLYEPLVALAAKVVGRPVKLILTRSEELLATNPSPPIQIHLKVGAKNDGTLTAIEAQIYLDGGCYPANMAGFVGYQLGSFYPCENMHLHGIDVVTFKQSSAAYRAPGAPTVFFAIDTAIDEIAERLGLDSIDVRLKNAARPGALRADDKPWPNIGMRETLERLKQHPLWQNREQSRAQGRGVGIAIGGWMGGTSPAAAACGLNRDGTVHVQIGSTDISGTMTGFTLMVAEAFGVTPDKVRIVNTGDTTSAPFSTGSGGSKVTYTTGAAVVKAAQEARQQALAIAAEEFEAAVEDLEIVDGQVRVKGVPTKSISLGKIAEKGMSFGGEYPPVYAEGRTVVTDQSPAFNAQLVEVEVDRETGEVKVLRQISAQDVGRAINPMAIDGQMSGGGTQGLGWALYEQMSYGSDGQLLSGSFMDYTVPDILQSALDIENIIVEVPSDYGPFGARGVGEPPITPTAAAVANAIAHATGVRMTDIPMTAPRVLQALYADR